MNHIQRTVPNWLEAVHRLPDGALEKATENYQIFREIKGINPNIFTAHRMVRDHWQHYTGQLDSGWFDWEAAKSMAHEWFGAFIDQTFFADIAPYCDAVSWHNEIWANSQTEIEQLERVSASEAAVHVWNNDYRHLFNRDIKLIIGEAAVGNWMPRRIAELSIESNNLLGYHPYDYWLRKIRGSEGQIAALSMLWDSMEFDWNLEPNWIFTEAGPFEGAETGWRSEPCLQGDRVLYVDAVRQWIQDVAQTPAYQEGRIRGFALFTTGSPSSSWDSFETRQPELNELADMIQAEWQPGTTPPSPSPPLPYDCKGKPRIQYPRVYNVIPQDTTEERAAEIFRHGWNESRETAGGSFDDAGIGDLGHKTAILWDIPLSEHGEYLSWYAEHYPYTMVLFRGDFGPTFALGSPVNGIPLYVTSPFGVPRDYSDPPDGINESLHGGIDFRVLDNNGVAMPIVAVKEGTILWASNLRRSGGPSMLGNHVIQQLNNGLIVWYGHMESMTVQAGHSVLRGDMLGLGGNTGNVWPRPTPDNPRAGSHLHLTIQSPGNGINDSRYKFSDVIDPAPLLGL